MVRYPQAWGFSFRNVTVKWTYKPGHQNTLTSFLQIRLYKGCQSSSTAWTIVGEMKNCRLLLEKVGSRKANNKGNRLCKMSGGNAVLLGMLS